MSTHSKILVVDDEAAVRLVLNRFLTSAGFQVIECADGGEALERVRQDRPALILLDVEMPRLDGWRTLKELREHGCRLPVLMLTHVDNIPARIKGLEAGADDYLGKPCDMTELLARVKALLRRSWMTAHVPVRLRFDDLLVDLEEKKAQRGKQPVNLTRTEYALLTLLSQHPGKPVMREVLIKHVWGADEESHSHSLDTHLWRLRKKLGDDAREPRWIRNLPGMGYVLECEIENPATAQPGAA